jgi:hypothetical protein
MLYLIGLWLGWAPVCGDCPQPGCIELGPCETRGCCYAERANCAADCDATYANVGACCVSSCAGPEQLECLAEAWEDLRACLSCCKLRYFGCVEETR